MSSQSSRPVRRDPAAAAAIMERSDSHVVVRLMPSSGLEGAFRVHVLPESLDQAHLRLGDLCEIASEDDCVGYGIAWRADDRMGNRPKVRPIKMTEIVRNAFGFQEGSKVTIASTQAQIYPADKIVLSDVTPAEFGRPEELEDDTWKSRTISLLCGCEALAPGISFDVKGKRKNMRKRYCIEHIESSNASSDAPCLFRFTDATSLIFPDSASLPTPAGERANANLNVQAPATAGDGQPSYQLSMERIGGLVDQCRHLNGRLRRMLNTTDSLSERGVPFRNKPVLLHGIEGTGKTMVLELLAEAPFRKVVRVGRPSLTGGTIAKNRVIIQGLFEEAIKNQPSLVLMDDLEELVPADDIAYASTICEEMNKLSKKRVMLVGATRSPANVKSTLFWPGRFIKLIELPIPDVTAREQILNILRRKPVHSIDPVSSTTAMQTHGFTGKDVALLFERAEEIAIERFEQHYEDLQAARSPTLPRYSQVCFHTAETYTEPTSIDEKFEIALDDFKQALLEIRPTALREILAERPKTRWDDIGGSDHMKAIFDKIIGWPLLHKDLLAQARLDPPKGVLLYGPPGCSKTLTAQAVASTYNFNFIAIKGAELISMYVGESERAIRDVFRKARAAAPCVIFFDEIDSIGGDRDGGGGTKGLNVLTTLLNEMDGFDVLKDVFILAATNRPDTLDPALMRPGRFDSHVYLGPPNPAARKEILSIATRGVAIAGDVDFDALVADTDGYSGAEIARICREAKNPAFERCLLNHSESVKLEAADFQQALRSTNKGITKEMLEAFEAFGKRKHA